MAMNPACIFHIYFLFWDILREPIIGLTGSMFHRYKNEHDGLAGNDDGGTLSAWYIFSSFGFYPLAGTERYVLGSPILIVSNFKVILLQKSYNVTKKTLVTLYISMNKSGPKTISAILLFKMQVLYLNSLPICPYQQALYWIDYLYCLLS